MFLVAHFFVFFGLPQFLQPKKEGCRQCMGTIGVSFGSGTSIQSKHQAPEWPAKRWADGEKPAGSWDDTAKCPGSCGFQVPWGSVNLSAQN